MAEAMREATRAMELNDPDSDFPLIDRYINRFVEAVGITVLVIITSLIFTNACLRYFFSTSLIWGDELAVSLIPWLAFIGLFLSVRRRQYIRISFLVDKLPSRIGFYLEISGHVLAALVFAYLAWGAFSLVSMFGGDKTTYLRLPKGIFMSALLIGSIAVVLAFLIPVRRQKRDDAP